MSLTTEAREAWRYRELLKNLVDRELQVRYKNSLLGVAWSLAIPLFARSSSTSFLPSSSRWALNTTIRRMSLRRFFPGLTS